jgi:F-type H+-transporting ATPase subunit epsilon
MAEKSLTLELVTPEKVAMQGQADFVVLPAYEGEMGVLPNHEAFLVQLTAGEVRVTENGQVRRFAVSGGFAEIKDNRVSLFAETAEMADQIDAERAKQSLEKAKAEMARKDLDPITLAAAEASLRRAQVRLLVATRRHGSAVRPRHDER